MTYYVPPILSIADDYKFITYLSDPVPNISILG